LSARGGAESQGQPTAQIAINDLRMPIAFAANTDRVSEPRDNAYEHGFQISLCLGISRRRTASMKGPGSLDSASPGQEILGRDI